MTTKQISIFLENRPGALAEICAIMEAESIDMRAMCVAEADTRVPVPMCVIRQRNTGKR